MAKIRPQQRGDSLKIGSEQEKWQKYLNKYYLSIKKVKPFLKK